MSKFPSGKMYHGSNLIGTTAEKIYRTTNLLVFGVLIKAHKDNTGIVYIGEHGVTANTDGATDGMPLEAGDSLFLEFDSLDKLFAIATAANQKIFFTAI